MELMTIIRAEIRRAINGGRNKREPQTNVMATVTSFNNNGVMVRFDDGGDAVGPYKRLEHYSPSNGDRVQLARVGVRGKYVVQGKVV
ncbi:hypothetical protein [Geomicrobium sp. JCM 19038]|uniref:hypothetical protein n=1 Tax=Geomicrobium sp. JCM 19038 TaxID=1460635 RepID=UPI00045F302D|nr:hypothetical protein [Geomicrobium sp. JCM 19038]GAK09017.1 hypothetical protein JCM19038_2828 [Geomicrobium sp. JCM 19038]